MGKELNGHYCAALQKRYDNFVTKFVDVLHKRCDKLYFSQYDEQTVSDQLELKSLQKYIDNVPMFKGVKIVLPTSLNECYDWTKKALLLLFRNAAMNRFENSKDAIIELDCSSCGIHDVPCLQNSTPEIKAAMLDEISFDEDTKTNENQKVKSSKGFKKIFEKERSKFKVSFWQTLVAVEHGIQL